MPGFSKRLIVPSAIAAAVALGLASCGGSHETEELDNPPYSEETESPPNSEEAENPPPTKEPGSPPSTEEPDSPPSTEEPGSTSCAVDLPGVGGLSHTSADAPIKHLSKMGWRTEIAQGRVTVMPPAEKGVDNLQYFFDGAHEGFDETSLRDWPGGPRTIVLPGNTKLTMHAEAGRLNHVSLYDGDESHDVDVNGRCHAITRSAVEGAEAVTNRDDAEADGEGGYLLADFSLSGRPGLFHLVNAYLQFSDEDGTAMEPVPEVGIVGSVHAYDPSPMYSHLGYDRIEVFTPLPAAESPDADVEETCTAAPGEVRGRLTQETGFTQDEETGELIGKPLDYEWSDSESDTRININININKYTVTTTVNGMSTWQVWGDPHEKFNGKHIKDWLGKRRTLLLPGGVKVTMHALGPTGVVHTTSIYDGTQSHEIDNATNQTLHSCVNAAVARERDAQEHDGETAVLGVLRSKHSELGATYAANVYLEEAGVDGGPHELRFIAGSLALTGEKDITPNEVNKLWKKPD